MACSHRHFAGLITIGGWALLLASQSYAQGVPVRMRGLPTHPQAPAPSVSVPAAAPTSQPPSAGVPADPAAATAPVSMLQQPAQEARIVFTDNNLAIHAENSSLAAILHQFSATSGMHITGLGSDERVFGNFGPGAPRDVLADLLNGTAYNLFLLGDLSNGAPRELILSPATHGGAAPAPPPEPLAGNDDAVAEQETVEPPPPPEVSPATVATPPTPPTPGVRSPQQLFEQLQQMRQQQQQQPGAQQPPPQQQ